MLLLFDGSSHIGCLSNHTKENKMSVANEAIAYPLNIIQSAVMVAVMKNQPVCLIGIPGCAKSSIIHAITRQLLWALFDFRCSDKEPPDIGGMPFIDAVNKMVEWLQSQLMPFERFDKNGKLIKPNWKDANGNPTEWAILFLDELDRATMEVLNVALQVILDRSVNGHKLYANVRIVAACNGESDIGTTQFSEALSTRMTHLYISHNSEENVDNWCKWARTEKIPSYALAFAKYQRKEVFGADISYPERAKCNARSYHNAIRLLEGCHEIGQPWSLNPKVINALIFGTIGRSAGTALIEIKKKAEECPQPDEVFKDPKGAKLPKEPGLYYATATALVDDAAPVNEEGVAVEDKRKTEAFCKYVGRWPSEYQGQFWAFGKNRMTYGEEDAYKIWDNKNQGKG